MRILIMGAGALGSAYGAILSRHGHDVTFVARGAHLQAMRERGLELRRPTESFTLRPVDAVARPSDAKGDIELVLFTVKAYDTETAIEALRPAVGPETKVLSLQNGVDGVEQLGVAFGAQRVIAGTTTFGAAIAEPGVVVDGGVPVASTIAELAGGITPRLEAIAAVLGEAGLPATVSADPYLTVWRKFLLFAPGATRQSACAEPFGPIFALPEGLALCRQLVMEAVAVGRAEKVALPDDIVETIMAFTALVPPGATSSMARDFEGRRRVELEQSTGTIVRRRRAHGVPTPAFDALYAVLKVRALAYGGLREG